MKNKKRRIELYSFYDHTGIKGHLEKMSRKGWMVESISNRGWKYHKISPSNLTFAVSYCPRMSVYDPEPTAEQLDFLDFCACTGWRPACGNGQIQLFYNEREDPIPIETEPALELETIHKSAKKSFLPAHAVLLVCALLQLMLVAFRLSDDPMELLVSTSSLCSGFCWMMLFLSCIAEIGGYFRWYRKAKIAAQQGEFLNVKGHVRFSWVICTATALVALWWFISLFTTKNRLLSRTGFLMLGYVPVLSILTNAVRQFLKRKKASRAVNKVVTILSCAFLAMAYIGCIAHLVLSNVFSDSESLRQYEYDFPLALEDLDSGEYGSYMIEKRGNESPFLESAAFHQHPDPWLDSYDLDGKELMYTITTVKFPGLYPLCKQTYLQRMEEAFGENVREEVMPKAVLQKQKASFWNAQEVYRQVDPYMGPCNWYLLCYANRMVEISFSWEPTKAQLAAAAKRLSANRP